MTISFPSSAYFWLKGEQLRTYLETVDKDIASEQFIQQCINYIKKQPSFEQPHKNPS